jgi:hypothetical protein
MEREVCYRRRGPPVVQRAFVRSRHESACAAGAYAIVVPVRRKEAAVRANAAVGGWLGSSRCSVALGRSA